MTLLISIFLLNIFIANIDRIIKKENLIPISKKYKTLSYKFLQI